MHRFLTTLSRDNVGIFSKGLRALSGFNVDALSRLNVTTFAKRAVRDVAGWLRQRAERRGGGQQKTWM